MLPIWDKWANIEDYELKIIISPISRGLEYNQIWIASIIISVAVGLRVE